MHTRRCIDASAPPSRRTVACVAIVAVFASLVLAPHRAGAQSGHAVGGVVIDSAAGVGIAGAEVSIEGTGFRAITDQRGAFRMVGAGQVGTLMVRRLGFRPASVGFALDSDTAAVRVRLAPAVQHLSAVVVHAEKMRYSGRLADYYQRLERKVSGTFISRADIDREKPRQLTDLLRLTAGLQVGKAAGSASRPALLMRGRNCPPIVWLDGAAMTAGDVDLNSFPPTSLEGIEMYLGASNAPTRYTAMGGRGECGTILLWSRGVDTEPRSSGRTTTAAELEAMIASVTIYTADQVEAPAAADTGTQIGVPYPASLRASGLGGMVIAEFVVDTLGQVETGTFGVVSATHPLFVDAVREAVAQARFRPAMRKGRAVRQLVRQPYEFVPPVHGRG